MEYIDALNSFLTTAKGSAMLYTHQFWDHDKAAVVSRHERESHEILKRIRKLETQDNNLDSMRQALAILGQPEPDVDAPNTADRMMGTGSNSKSRQRHGGRPRKYVKIDIFIKKHSSLSNAEIAAKFKQQNGGLKRTLIYFDDIDETFVRRRRHALKTLVAPRKRALKRA